MFHYYQALISPAGGTLPGYFARVIDPDALTTVTMASDDAGTPIIAVSGVADMAKADDAGNLSFYVEPGTYHLDIYSTDAVTFLRRLPGVAMGAENLVTALGAGAVARTFEAKAREILSPEDFGAAGDGTTNDLAALVAAAAAACTYGLELRGKPGATYAIASSGNTSTPLIPLTAGIKVRGLSIKVLGTTGLYPCIIGAYPSTATDLSGLSIRDCEFDHNVMAGPNLQVSGSVLVAQYSMDTLIVLTGDDIDFCDNVIRNASCTNPVYINGDPGRTSRIAFNRNKIIDFGNNPAGIFHDASGCYLVGDYIECIDNYVAGASWTAPATVAGLELHPGKFAEVRGNVVTQMRDGCNFYGVTDNGGNTGDTENSIVTDNVFDVRAIGLLLGSGTLGSHISGFGLRAVTVSNNNIRIRQSYVSDATQELFGIAISSGATLPVKGLVIEGNRIEFDEELTPPTYSVGECVGIGINEASLNAVYEDVRFADNEIVNAPTTAFQLCAGNGTLKNCSIAGLRIVRPGSGTATGINVAHRRGVVIDPNTISGSFSLTGLDIVDDRATTKMTRAITLSASVAVSAPVLIEGRVTVSGTTTTAYVNLVEKADNNITPFVDLAQVGLGGIVNSAGATFKLGSRVTDRANGIEYVMLTDGGTTFSARPVFAQAAAVADLAGGASLADVITAFNTMLASDRTAKQRAA